MPAKQKSMLAKQNRMPAKQNCMLAKQNRMPAKQNCMLAKQNCMSTKTNGMSMLRKWFEIGGEFLSSLLFPPRCPVCDEILAPEEAENGIHLACENKLYPVEGAVCMHCGRPLGQIKSRENIPQQKKTQNFSKDTGVSLHVESKFAYEDVVPAHLKTESTYEYCRECRRKGYAPASGAELYSRKNQQKSCMPQTASNITQAKSLYLYKGAIKTSMYRFKYANKREYARFFARQAVKKYGTWLGVASGAYHPETANFQRNASALNHPIDVIIPVPMYLPKQKQRGYNQAEVFATELSKLTSIPVDRACIQRVKDTTPQKNLNGAERKNNLENAFQKGKSIVQYSHILIVDDIYTTGYTAEAVARELRKQGARQIYLLSVCIGGND